MENIKTNLVKLLNGNANGDAIGDSFLFKLDTSFLFVGIDFWGCLSLLLVGLLVASAMFIPGVSGTMLLIAMGYWDPISGFFQNLIAFSNIGISFLYIGFVFWSIVSAFYNYDVVVTYQVYQTTNFGNYILAFFLLIAGISIGYVLTTREKRKKDMNVEI